MFYIGIYIAGFWIFVHLIFFVFFPESVFTEISELIFRTIGYGLSIIAIVILGLSTKYTLR